MSEYEAKIWQGAEGWHAKVLRNGVYFDSRNTFKTRDEAVDWARAQADADRAYIEAENNAERVEL